MRRATNAALDKMIDAEQIFPVLDQGHIQVIDYMGDDSAVVQAARVSYGAGTKTVHEDRGLIRYLLRHYHTTPLEMCELKIRVRAPIDCIRQWIRHRTASVNEYSTRYSEAIDARQCTPQEEWRYQSKSNKQGSTGYLVEDGDLGVRNSAILSDKEARFHTSATALYQERLSMGVAREQARKDLPLSTYTELYWKIDLHNLLHFLRLRMDSHAQKEIRAYATIIGEQIVAPWVPSVWEAFQDYRLDAKGLTGLDVDMLCAINEKSGWKGLGLAFGWLDDKAQPVEKNRELQEFTAKAHAIGVKLPW